MLSFFDLNFAFVKYITLVWGAQLPILRRVEMSVVFSELERRRVAALDEDNVKVRKLSIPHSLRF